MTLKNLKKFTALLTLLITLFALSFCIQNAPSYASAEEESVYVGGFPIGLSLYSDGLIVEDYKTIITANGNFLPAKDSGIMIGDLITHIDGIKVNTPQEFQDAIGTEEKLLKITILRNNNSLNLLSRSIHDPLANSPKLGLIVRNEISGIGTVTYIDKLGNFCALGHKISDEKEINYTYYQKGSLFEADVIGVYKGENGEAGALKGVINRNVAPIGKVSKNCEFGVYGNLENLNKYNHLTLVKKGSKIDAKPGKAYIYSTIDGNTPQKYDIEIVKCIQQDEPKTKSMIIRITDKDLIEKTGGIVQGMSGSPIIQDGKLIGAVTHVLLNDSKLGYAIYSDWLS